MGDLILSPVVDTTISKLISAAAGQINDAVRWKKELVLLQDKLTMIQAVLQDAGQRQVTDPAVKRWLLKLREVADDADYTLDEVAYESVKRRVKIQNQMMKKVRYFFTPNNPLAFGLRMAHKIKKVIAMVDGINNEAQWFGLQSRLATTNYQQRRNLQTHSFIGAFSQFVGREDDVSKIVQLLTDPTNELPLCVLSIVGMAGLGKTTLAQSVRSHDQIQNHFGKIMWVCVSENFDVERILAEMLESLTKKSGAIRNKDTVVQEIRSTIGENNYLLILDDVWNKESQKWEDLKRCLLGMCKTSGNRVVVTTRDKNVALTMGTLPGHMHHLELLKDVECWSIIKIKVFGDASKHLDLELENIGWDFARKCRGVPLVASVVGGILCTKRPDKAEWLPIKSKIDALGSLEYQDDGIMQILQLSFDNLLKPGLKQCFAFCCIFPKDYVMKRETLIQLWMAEGFLPLPEETSIMLEDIGDEYFNDLLSYSLFQEGWRDAFGSIAGCKMHDLIHDFAQTISKYETVILKTLCSGSNISSFRHLNLICDQQMVPTTLGDVAQLHTLFSEHGFPRGMSGNFKRLRVLNFPNAFDAEELPACFSNMKSLRYLDLSRTQIKELPRFVTNLYNLQTFKFLSCRSLKMPPGGIGNLINLRHVYFNHENCMPTNLGRLTNLQTLPLFFVGATKGRKIEELECLRRLRGRLEIRNLELVKDKSEAMRAKLHEKAVNDLNMTWGKEGNHDEDVLEGLRPHSNLQRLDIYGYGGKNLPSWMTSNCSYSNEMFLIKNLVKLHIRGCKKLESIPAMKELSSLQLLYIGNCNELTTIADEAFVTFESLQELIIGNCPKLGSVPTSGLQSLLKLSIFNCSISSIGDILAASKCLKSLSLGELPNLGFIPSIDGLTSLQDIALSELPNLRSIPSLDGLISLQTIKLSKLPDLRFIPSLDGLTSLQSIYLFVLPNLRFTPSLDGLTSLQNLFLSECEIECLPSGLSSCTALKILYVNSCHNLISIPEELKELHSLVELTIVDCSKLRSIPEKPIACLTSLKKLNIGGFCEELEEFPGLGSILYLKTSLEELRLYGWKKVTTLPPQIQHLTALKELFISKFDEVETLPEWLGNLSSLKELHVDSCSGLRYLSSGLSFSTGLDRLAIQDCPNLVSIPEDVIGHLTQLKSLSIGGFSKELEEFPGLNSINTSLEDLQLYGWEKLSQLPHQIQHLNALQYLSVSGFDGVEVLPEWLRNLSSLEYLVVRSCKNLKQLPSAEAFRRLSKLLSLDIYGCLLLEERCAKESGPEWSKISHIPNIHINGKSF
ncbi:hypothetical protein SLEP1_g170 [Rubroshorea leprosula]|uniref:Disease resistance protein RGA3 n=1 Tax=Rubroshorea leprosula TaxID=152421 RepID=A0AAV5HGM8_9ROSI|nr:hypothetical protein SLEP1_g170 [Rubroshorea leprosula]